MVSVHCPGSCAKLSLARCHWDGVPDLSLVFPVPQVFIGDSVGTSDAKDPSQACVDEDLQLVLHPFGESPGLRAIQQHRSHVGVEQSQFGGKMDVGTPPDGFEGSECESCLGYPGLDVFISTSCLADGASQVGEFVDVFDLLFTQADCFCLSCAGSHCLNFLGVDLQAGVPCGDTEALCILLYVLKGVDQQADVICEIQVFKLVHECPLNPARWVHGCPHHPVNYKEMMSGDNKHP